MVVEAREEPGQQRGFRGVVVTGLTDNALALGKVLPGDLIMSVNNSRISGAREFFLHLASSAAVQDTSLMLIRGGRSIRVTLPALPRRE